MGLFGSYIADWLYEWISTARRHCLENVQIRINLLQCAELALSHFDDILVSVVD